MGNSLANHAYTSKPEVRLLMLNQMLFLYAGTTVCFQQEFGGGQVERIGCLQETHHTCKNGLDIYRCNFSQTGSMQVNAGVAVCCQSAFFLLRS